MASPNYTSGLKTADALIRTGKGILAGVQIITDGTNDATLVIYDGVTAAGDVLFKMTVTGTDDAIPVNLPIDGVYASTGLYADVTVAAGTVGYIVYFR